MTDYELYQLLDANGYEASKENLNVLKENVELIDYLLETPTAQNVASDGNAAYFDPDDDDVTSIRSNHRTKDGDYIGELDYKGQTIKVLGNVNKKKDREMGDKLQNGVARGLLPRNWGASSSELIQSNLDNKVAKISKQKNVATTPTETIKEDEELFLLEQATVIGLEFSNLPINDCIDIYESLDDTERAYMDTLVLTEEMGMILEDMKSKHSVLLEANKEFDFDVLFLESVGDLWRKGKEWVKDKANKVKTTVTNAWNSAPVTKARNVIKDAGKEKDYATGRYVGDGFKLTNNRDQALKKTTGSVWKSAAKGAAIGATAGWVAPHVSALAGAGVGALVGAGKNIYNKIKKKNDERRNFAKVNKDSLVSSGAADSTSMDAYIRGKHAHVKQALQAQKNDINFQRASKEQQKMLLNATKQQAKKEFKQGKKATLGLVAQSRQNAKGKSDDELNADSKTITEPDGSSRTIKRGEAGATEKRFEAVKESYIILKKNR